MTEWHENAEFWELLGPVMFSKERWEQAAVDAPKIAALLELGKGGRVLDMACGTGWIPGNPDRSEGRCRYAS